MKSSAARCTAAGLTALLLTALPGAALGAEKPGLSGTVYHFGTFAVPVPVQPTASGPDSDAALGPDSDAVPTISGDTALALVQKYFTVSEGPGRLEVELSEDGPRPVWRLVHRVDEWDGSSYGSEIGRVDAVTGRILYVDLTNELRTVPQKGPLGEPRSEEEARSRAWALVQALYPDEVDALEPLDSSDAYAAYGRADAYTFVWTKHHDGIPILYSAVQVLVDRFTLDYLSFSTDLEQSLVVPDAQPGISAEEALAAFRSEAEASLLYRPIYSQHSGAPGVKLLYDIQVPAALDAVSGEFLNDGNGVQFLSKEVPEGGTALKPDSLPLSPQHASAFSREVLELPADPLWTLNVGAHDADQGTISFHWTAPEGDAAVDLQQETGRVVFAYRHLNGDNSEETPDAAPQPLEASEQQAVRVVQRLYTDLIPDLRLTYQVDIPTADEVIRIFHFQRHVNGVPYAYDGVTVRVDPFTGQWVNIWLDWTPDVAVPAPEDVITPEEALEAFFAGPTSLSWMISSSPSTSLRSLWNCSWFTGSSIRITVPMISRTGSTRIPASRYEWKNGPAAPLRWTKCCPATGPRENFASSSRTG